MAKDERKKAVEEFAETFSGLEEGDKSYIVGYIAGKQEERQRWERKQEVATA